jgi:hypothetical protein
MKFPTINEIQQNQVFVNTWKGYNHNYKISDGESWDMKNLSLDNYPVLSTRKARKIRTIGNNLEVLAAATFSDSLYLVVWSNASSSWSVGKAYGTALDEDSENNEIKYISSYFSSHGISTGDKNQVKQIVVMGGYAVIFPANVYVNLEGPTDCGTLGASYDSGELTVTLTPYLLGTGEITPTASSSVPENPQGGDLWMDTSSDSGGLKQYDSSSEMWVSVATTYVKITADGIGKQFSVGDGVNLEGIGSRVSESGDDDDVSEETVLMSYRQSKQLSALNGSKIIQEVGSDYIVVIGLLDAQKKLNKDLFSVGVSRTTPDMDYVTVAQNRIWGCKYGTSGTKTLNELYCCALGDFKNWEKYQGISTDSWTASTGQAGAWTGAITYEGRPYFFKEDTMYKIYISASGAHQVVDSAVRGVKAGCAGTLQVVNSSLYYLSGDGVMGYSGSTPVLVSDAFGEARYKNGIAGHYGYKYYLQAQNMDSDEYALLVYDVKKGLWTREQLFTGPYESSEPETAFSAFASLTNSLVGVAQQVEPGINSLCVSKIEGVYQEYAEKNSNFAWYMQSGRLGIDYHNRKYISRLNFRLRLGAGAWMKCYIMYDGDGEWHEAGSVANGRTDDDKERTFLFPLRPRRCDYFFFKLEGEGDVKLFSMSKMLETGSDFA